ncbi:hypothetical protein COP1_011891 [Malus domestica]
MGGRKSRHLSLSLLFSLLVGIGIQWRNGVLRFGVRRSDMEEEELTRKKHGKYRKGRGNGGPLRSPKGRFVLWCASYPTMERSGIPYSLPRQTIDKFCLPFDSVF